MSLYARLAAGVLIVLAIAAAWWKVDHVLAAREEVGYQRRAAEDGAAANAQAARNRDLQRAAELRYIVAAEPRDRFFVTTVREIRHDTDNLAACVLTPGAVRRLHDAAACARGDSAAACGPGEPVPVSR
jgi:hypothetical protein